MVHSVTVGEVQGMVAGVFFSTAQPLRRRGATWIWIPRRGVGRGLWWVGWLIAVSVRRRRYITIWYVVLKSILKKNLCDIVCTYVDIPDCRKYTRIVMTNAREYVTTIFDDSTHALNVSFHIVRRILFRHSIGVNCILYMAQYPILQVSYVWI